MFDLITEKTPHMPSGGRVATLLSSVVHAGLLGAIVTVPLLFVTNTLPHMPTMLAFVAATAPPPTPAPPPPPPAPRAKDVPAKVLVSNQNAAPLTAPSRIEPEPAGPTDGDDGAVGGVDGGISGGIVGEIVGNLAAPPPPQPPPPPPPAAPPGPVRIGGEIRPPTLLQRVEPVYPVLALNAHVEGTVILEAIIDENGTVQSLKVLRSVSLLDKAAVAAVEQWRYSPVILNGRPVPVILTVVVSFKIPVT